MTCKILGQVAIADINATYTLYTVPAGKECVVSTLALVNGDTTGSPVTVWAIKNGDVAEQKNVIVPASQIAAKDAKYLTIGITLSAGDSLAIKAGNLMFSASAFGNERAAT